MNEKLVNYIRENKEVYTREAITRHLLEQLYSPEDIEEAWAMVGQEVPTGKSTSGNEPLENVWRMGKYWFTALGFFLGVPIIIGIVSRIFRGEIGYIQYEPGFVLSLILVVIALIACIVTIFAWWDTHRAISRGLLFGLILWVIPPFVGVVIIFGICVVG